MTKPHRKHSVPQTTILAMQWDWIYIDRRLYLSPKEGKTAWQYSIKRECFYRFETVYFVPQFVYQIGFSIFGSNKCGFLILQLGFFQIESVFRRQIEGLFLSKELVCNFVLVDVLCLLKYVLGNFKYILCALCYTFALQ